MFKGVVPALQMWGQSLYASPLTKQVLETAKRTALEAGLNVASDTLAGKNVKDSLRGNALTAKQKVSASLLSALKKVKTQHFDEPPSATQPTKTPRKRVKLVPVLATVSGVRRDRAKPLKKGKRNWDLFDEHYP